MNVIFQFPATVEQFLLMYGFTDTEHFYTNGQRCITIHRVRQMLGYYFPERTCTVDGIDTDEYGYWVYLSCGHVTLSHGKPSYCSTCGAKVIYDD